MKLADYLFRSGMTTTQLRQALGVSCRSTITRYLNGERVPSNDIMLRIKALTGGQVQWEDFLRGGNPDCATVITLANGQQRLVFPWSTRRSDLAAAESLERRRTTGDVLTPPAIQIAVTVLRGRAVQRGQGWFLDNRPSDAPRIIRAANRVLGSV
jgi:hypothetical protein